MDEGGEVDIPEGLPEGLPEWVSWLLEGAEEVTDAAVETMTVRARSPRRKVLVKQNINHLRSADPCTGGPRADVPSGPMGGRPLP
eukprot:473296-Prorocentrum_minimum.AAC.1